MARGFHGLLILIVLVTAACGGDRPPADEWEQRWEAATGSLPDPGALGEETCRDTLARLRDWRQRLVPAPSEELGEAARQWLDRAEEVFFECPPPAAAEPAYQRLEELEEQVEGLLDKPVRESTRHDG